MDDKNTHYYSTIDIQGDLAHDVAAYKWGNGWKLPRCNGKSTVSEMLELDLLSKKYVSDESLMGVEGTKFGYTETFVFLPYANYYDKGTLKIIGKHGLYWSSSIDEEYYAWYLLTDLECIFADEDNNQGQSVRPMVSLP